MKLNTNLRNAIIVALIAAVVAIVPGGGTAANFVEALVGLALLTACAWIGAQLYRTHRGTLYGLGDRRRTLLYIAVGIATVTLTASNRLWSTGFGTVVWILLCAGAVYIVVAVFRSSRRY